MSTKIYNGWRVRHPSTVDGLNGLCRQLSEVLGVERQRAYDTLIVGLACFAADDDTFGLVAPSDGAARSPALSQALMATFRLVADAEKSPYRNPVDFGFEVVFCHDPDDPDWLYALTYTEHRGYEPVLEAIGFVEYAYWDNTDPPDDVTAADWDARRDRWNRLVGWDPPSTRGLAWTLGDVNGRLRPTDAEIAEMIASAAIDDTARLDRLAKVAARHGVDPATLGPLPPLTPEHLRRVVAAQR